MRWIFEWQLYIYLFSRTQLTSVQECLVCNLTKTEKNFNHFLDVVVTGRESNETSVVYNVLPIPHDGILERIVIIFLTINTRWVDSIFCFFWFADRIGKHFGRLKNKEKPSTYNNNNNNNLGWIGEKKSCRFISAAVHSYNHIAGALVIIIIFELKCRAQRPRRDGGYLQG